MVENDETTGRRGSQEARPISELPAPQLLADEATVEPSFGEVNQVRSWHKSRSRQDAKGRVLEAQFQWNQWAGMINDAAHIKELKRSEYLPAY